MAGLSLDKSIYFKTDREQEFYAMGFQAGLRASMGRSKTFDSDKMFKPFVRTDKRKPKRKLSAWNKFVKANSNKKIYKFANGKLKLKKMGIAFRKTRAGRKK